MFSNYLKSLLVFNRSQDKAPNFILVYLLISLIWHNAFFITLVLSDGGISEKLSAALAENSHQYIVVLSLTFLFFILRLSYLYFANRANDFIEADEPIEAKLGSDQVFSKNNDVVRLLDLLEETKSQLAKVKAAEAPAKTDKTTAISQRLALQNELDMALADITILTKSNAELKRQLNEHSVA
jgi:hypothetical protein